MSGAEDRALAARLLQRIVVRGETTDQAFARHSPSPLVQELVFGSLRHYFSLDQAVRTHMNRPLKPRDQDIRLLIIVGVYQLRFARTPDHAALFETVDACGRLRKPWAKGLVNAVLRKCGGDASAERSFEHPAWLESLLRSSYPDAEQIMTANNQRAPMTLRIHTGRTSAAAYCERLNAAGLASRPPHPGEDPEPEALRPGAETRVLEAPVPMRTLPGYQEGLVSVQDAGAQFAARLLSPTPGDRLLDACAAPGGKLFHLLETCPGIDAVAVENSEARLMLLCAEAQRLGHQPATLLGDATGLDWWDKRPFRQILVDAPCTGTGTLRRHPEIKVLRRAADVAEYAALQGRLLDNLWRVLEPGGTLLYCTCSILEAENDGVVGEFLGRQQDAVISAFRLVVGRATRHGWQLLPVQSDTDGFYYARLNKAAP